MGIRRLSGMIVVLALVAPVVTQVPDNRRPEPGHPFPAVTLPSLADGSPLSVEQFRGRKVLLHQFASW